jgi:hypothetical protein
VASAENSPDVLTPHIVVPARGETGSFSIKKAGDHNPFLRVINSE